MSLDLSVLNQSPRILIEVDLKPVAGTRIQPTGFPDLGPASYQISDGTEMLLVESAQSMANRLETVCWDEANDDLVPELQGLPFIKVTLAGIGDGTDTTNSFLEFHRMNSPYIMSGVTAAGKEFIETLKTDLKLAPAAVKKPDNSEEKEGDDIAGVVNLRRLAQVCFKYDPNSLVHGVFLEKIAGRLRHPRALSSFIEACGVDRANSGGVKFDRALPKPSVAGVNAVGGYGNVPFHRTEFTAKSITAFFSIDLAQIRGYGLGEEATKLLITLSLWKIRAFLNSTMRLRTACELELREGEKSVVGKRPDGFTLPSAEELTVQLKQFIAACKSLFADPVVTELTWNGGKKTEPKKR